MLLGKAGADELTVVFGQVRGGLTFREGHYICEAIAETGLLAALDLVVSLTPLSCSGARSSLLYVGG